MDNEQILVLDHEDPESQFIIQEQIGEGAYGSVYKAVHKISNRIVAVKIVPSSGEIQSLQKEIQILKDCRSEYVVKYYGSFYKNENLWLIMEYCAAGSVIDLVKITKRQLTEQEIAAILFYALKGIEYLHNNKKIHRDIKAGNILLDQKGNAKLADFGVSAQLLHTNANKETHIGTPFWMSPEVISKHKYNQLTDIWSLGITAIELAEGEPPYSHIHPVRALWVIRKNPAKGLTNPEQWSAEFNDFISSTLQVEPNERPTATQLLKHQFIQMGSKETRRLYTLVENSTQEIENYRLKKNRNEDNGPNPQTIITYNSHNSQDSIANSYGTVVEASGTLVVNNEDTQTNKELDFVNYAKGIKIAEELEDKARKKHEELKVDFESYPNDDEEEEEQIQVNDLNTSSELLEQMSLEDQKKFLSYLKEKMNEEIAKIKEKYTPKIKDLEKCIAKQEVDLNPPQKKLEQNLQQIINLPFNFQVNQELLQKLQNMKIPKIDLKAQQQVSSQLRSNPKPKSPFEFAPLQKK